MTPAIATSFETGNTILPQQCPAQKEDSPNTFLDQTRRVTSADAPEQSAVHLAMHATELLETVLLNLDSQTLISSQRVSKGFREVIQGSKWIQKKLFLLQPTFEESRTLGLVEDNTLVIGNCPYESSILNPLLFALGRDRNIGKYNLVVKLASGIIDKGNPGKNGKESWRQMYALSAPVNKRHHEEFVVTGAVAYKSRRELRHNPPKRLARSRVELHGHCICQNPIRNVKHMIDKDIRGKAEKLGCTMKWQWKTAELYLAGYSMPYGAHEELYLIVKAQESEGKSVQDWTDLPRSAREIVRTWTRREKEFGGRL